ncbi:MAG: hypothetical protein FWC32_03430 [Firmicutes bacterium]|nr:hypothetical protein [Bacillota bacterium]
MEKVKILDIENDGMGLAVEDKYLYVRCNRSIYKYDLTDMQIITENTITVFLLTHEISAIRVSIPHFRPLPGKKSNFPFSMSLSAGNTA